VKKQIIITALLNSMMMKRVAIININVNAAVMSKPYLLKLCRQRKINVE
jgi:hypothetical protein